MAKSATEHSLKQEQEKLALAVAERELKASEKASKESRVLLSFELLHKVPGRIRFRVKEFAFRTEFSLAFVRAAGQIPGVKTVRANNWCASVIVEYDESVISQERLWAQLRKINISPDLVPARTALPNLFTRIKLLFSFALRRLETLAPPVMQFAVGAASFGSALCGAPALVTTTLAGLAVLPIAGRAAQTALDEGRIGVDGLDGMAAALMIMQGNLPAASFMTCLIGLGEYIRELTAQRCKKMLDNLMGLAGSSAWLVKGNKRVCIPAEQVKCGDMIVVYPGELVPVDGEVLKGLACVNQAALTGESAPVEVQPGSHVFAGTHLEQGKILICCKASVKDSRAGRVIEMLKTAPVYETRTQNYAAKLADKMVLPILATAAICGMLSRNLTRVMSILIFDFSTGIRISAPTAILSSMQRAGRHGILMKNGAAVEKLSRVDALVIDKTGTLTSGEPQVTKVIALNGWAENEVLANAAAVEERLHHPAARAIVRHAHKSLCKIPDRDDSSHKNGMGVQAYVQGRSVICGSRRFMHSEHIDVGAAGAVEKEMHEKGESVAYVAIDGKLAGLIAYADRLRSEAPQVLKQLKRMGVKRIFMATGDHEHAARSIASICGIKEIIFNSFPEQKADLVRKLKSEGYTVAVVGDGINDSPALVHADLGVSLHSATDAARESSDLLLTDNDLKRLPEAIEISRDAMGLVRENLSFVALPNGIGLVLAACGLIGPATSTLLNNGSAILAAFNSLRPLFKSPYSSSLTDEKIS